MKKEKLLEQAMLQRINTLDTDPHADEAFEFPDTEIEKILFNQKVDTDVLQKYKALFQVSPVFRQLVQDTEEYVQAYKINSFEKLQEHKRANEKRDIDALNKAIDLEATLQQCDLTDDDIELFNEHLIQQLKNHENEKAYPFIMNIPLFKRMQSTS